MTPPGPPLLLDDPLAHRQTGRRKTHGAQFICAGAYRRSGAAACQFLGPGPRCAAATQPAVDARRAPRSQRRCGVRRDRAATRCPRRATAARQPQPRGGRPQRADVHRHRSRTDVQHKLAVKLTGRAQRDVDLGRVQPRAGSAHG